MSSREQPGPNVTGRSGQEDFSGECRPESGPGSGTDHEHTKLWGLEKDQVRLPGLWFRTNTVLQLGRNSAALTLGQFNL